MALDPEEFVTLTDHGSMKLRAAVLRAMTLELLVGNARSGQQSSARVNRRF